MGRLGRPAAALTRAAAERPQAIAEPHADFIPNLIAPSQNHVHRRERHAAASHDISHGLEIQGAQ
jgi:hypothetical protein